MLAAVLLLMSAALTGLRCIDAAHTAARMSAIGEPSDAVQNVAQKLVGPQATTALHRDGKWVAVTVRSLVPNSPWRWEVSHTAEIGRASCRERMQSRGVAVAGQ